LQKAGSFLSIYLVLKACNHGSRTGSNRPAYFIMYLAYSVQNASFKWNNANTFSIYFNFLFS